MTWEEFPCIYCGGGTQRALRHPTWRFCPVCEPRAAKTNADEVRLNYLIHHNPNTVPRTGYE